MTATRTFLRIFGVAIVISVGLFVSTSRFDLVGSGKKLVGDRSKAASPAPAQGHGQDAMAALPIATSSPLPLIATSAAAQPSATPPAAAPPPTTAMSAAPSAAAQGNHSATLDFFESIDLVRRFRARGAATCMESAKEVLSKQSGKIKLQFGTLGGWGNVVLQLLTVQTLSLYSGRPLEISKSTDFESLNFSRWFQIPLPRSDSFLKKAKRAYNMQDSMQPINCSDANLTKLQQPIADVNLTNDKRADNMKDLMQLINSADVDQVLNGLDWNVVEPVLALDLPNPLWKEDKACARNCMARALFDRVSVKLSHLLLAPLTSMLPTDALIGVHLRFGDKILMEKTGHKGEWAWISDERITAKDLRTIWAAIDEVIVALEQRDGVRARLFVATDNVDVLEDARARYGDVLLPEVSHAPPMHVFVRPPRQCDHEDWARQGSTEAYLQGFDKVVAEWFLLALSDVVVQGASSSFSDSAMLLGGQHLHLTCNHGECPCMPKNSLRALFDSLPSASNISTHASRLPVTCPVENTPEGGTMQPVANRQSQHKPKAKNKKTKGASGSRHRPK